MQLPIRCVILVVVSGGFLGCASTRDISRLEPFASYVGKTDYFAIQPANVYDLGFGGFVVDSVERYLDYPMIARIPAGQEVKIESAKRTISRPLLGCDLIFTHDYPVISLVDPRNPKRRMIATTEFRFLKNAPNVEANLQTLAPLVGSGSGESSHLPGDAR